MTGKITRVMGNRTNCFILGSDKTPYWAHVRDFPDPSIMFKYRKVSFRPKLAGPPEPGKPHPVTDVVRA